MGPLPPIPGVREKSDDLRTVGFYQEKRLYKASTVPSLDGEEKLQCYIVIG